MKYSRIVLILIGVCVFGTYSLLQQKIGQFECDNDCEEKWKNFIQKSQTTIIDIIQSNPYEIPGSSNPGFGTLISKENYQEGGKVVADLFLIEKINDDKFHTEINFIKSVLISQVNKIYQKNKNSNLKPENYYKYVDGTLMIYTYLGPCDHCLQTYQKLAKLFPNLQFSVYYSYAYYDSNLGLDLGFNLIQMYDYYTTCKNALFQMEKNLRIKNLYLPLKLFITNLNRNTDSSIKEVNDCIFNKKLRGIEKKFPNLKIKRLKLDEFIYKIEDSIFKIKN